MANQNSYRIIFEDRKGNKCVTGEMSLRKAQLLKSSKVYRKPIIVIDDYDKQRN